MSVPAGTFLSLFTGTLCCLSKGIAGLSDLEHIAQPSILNCTIDLLNVKSTILTGPLSDYSSAFDSSSDRLVQ